MDSTLERYSAHLRAAHAAEGTIRLRLDHAAAILALGPLDALDQEAVERWIAPRGRRYKAATLRSRRSSARRFLGWLVDAGVLATSPAERVRAIPVHEQPPKVIPDDDMRAVLARPMSSRDRGAVLLGRYGCLRLSEIARAHTRDRHGDQLRVLGKGGKERIIFMHPDLVHALDVLEQEQGHGYYLPGNNRPHVHPQALHKIIKRVTGWNPHALRHAGATAAYRATKDLRAVQLMLGHSSLKTTQRYLSLDEDALRAVGVAVGVREPVREPVPLRQPSPVRSDDMSMHVVEWAVNDPLSDMPAGLVRLVHLGPNREPYYRAVTANPDPEQRRLIGYYWTAQHARGAILYLLEQMSGVSVYGGGKVASLPPVEQKPPPHLLPAARPTVAA